MVIVDLTYDKKVLVDQAAQLLVDGFKDFAPKAWPDLDAALAEVKECTQEDRICRAAVADSGLLLGWTGGISHYGGNVWELHPIVVRRDTRNQGIGRALVNDLEREVKNRGGLTLWLGTDDEQGQTSLADVNLYENLWDRIQSIKNMDNHPFEFYHFHRAPSVHLSVKLHPKAVNRSGLQKKHGSVSSDNNLPFSPWIISV